MFDELFVLVFDCVQIDDSSISVIEDLWCPIQFGSRLSLVPDLIQFGARSING